MKIISYPHTSKQHFYFTFKHLTTILCIKIYYTALVHEADDVLIPYFSYSYCTPSGDLVSHQPLALKIVTTKVTYK